MEQKLPEEDIIRRYLLGALREPELSEIEQKLLSSEELSQTADLIEDEILEQYLDGDLDERDKRAVESHFLRPPAHREKLRFARLLRHHFELESPVAEPVPAKLLPPPVPPRYVWTYGGAVAAGLLAVVSGYLIVAQHNLKKDLADSQKSQEVLQATLARTASSPVALELKPGMSRSIGFANSGNSVPLATIRPSTRLFKVDLILPKTSAASFQVRLLDEKTGSEVWSKSGLNPVPGEPRLLFEMPTQGIRSGPYELVVGPVSNKGTQVRYPFDANVVQ